MAAGGGVGGGCRGHSPSSYHLAFPKANFLGSTALWNIWGGALSGPCLLQTQYILPVEMITAVFLHILIPHP